MCIRRPVHFSLSEPFNKTEVDGGSYVNMQYTLIIFNIFQFVSTLPQLLVISASSVAIWRSSSASELKRIFSCSFHAVWWSKNHWCLVACRFTKRVYQTGIAATVLTIATCICIIIILVIVMVMVIVIIKITTTTITTIIIIIIIIIITVIVVFDVILLSCKFPKQQDPPGCSLAKLDLGRDNRRLLKPIRTFWQCNSCWLTFNESCFLSDVSRLCGWCMSHIVWVICKIHV